MRTCLARACASIDPVTICASAMAYDFGAGAAGAAAAPGAPPPAGATPAALSRDRKSTRLNSSHSQISYAVFCLKKKKNITHNVCDVHTNQWAECIDDKYSAMKSIFVLYT